MVAARTMRPVVAATLVLLVGSSPALRAEPDKAAWDPTRTTSPETVAELKSLQDKVKQVVTKNTPATVGLLVRFPSGGPGAPAEDGAGSGVIVSEDGLVLTAAHVISNDDPEAPRWTARVRMAREIRIVLPYGCLPEDAKFEDYLVEAKALGMTRKEVDGGMVRITGKPPKGAKWPGAAEGKWPVADLGNSDDLKKGQWVVSMGHPNGPKWERPPAVRVGRFETNVKTETALRTDTTLVGGDSGGPLYDLTGKVVGIHSRIGLFLTYNMHVPMTVYKDQWARLRRGEVIGKSVTVEVGLTLDDGDNPVVKEVTADGPAAKAGFKTGDVIVKLNGEAVKTADDLVPMLTAFQPGEIAPVVVKRDDETKTLRLTFARKPKK